MRRDSRLRTITEALQTGPGNNRRAHRIWGRSSSATMDQGAQGNVWAADIHDLAVHVFTRLYGRPQDGEQLSPLAQAGDAKRRRDLVGEVEALNSGYTALKSAPWYPARHGDVVHLHYERAGSEAAMGQTYVVERGEHDGCFNLRLLAHSHPEGEDFEGSAGVFACADDPDPLVEMWMEAGPHRLTIVRDGQVVHDGPRGSTAAAGARTAARALAAAVNQAEDYLRRGEPELALARLKSPGPLPACGAPGFTAGQPDCARPRGHRGACSDNPAYVEPPHACPALPEQLHAVVTIGAKVTDVHFAGLYEDREAAVDHCTGYAGYDQAHTERYVQPAPGLPGETILTLPAQHELAATGVQLAVVVPLSVLPDPRAEDEWAAEGMATALTAEDYADDFRDVDE
ncbi:hypothetical protein [Streptomyces sp. TRM68416]|uniref:hypothetical protein n=1 Tax=Streptomyces sp. TRM68416 TaxID=2758412 RepID=UPI001661B480|nr:hypothetical protein [Streptomyces sp. TRM68416]MBD0837395.1 hypothetical protein [Streptomyces sp. TRM68416]